MSGGTAVVSSGGIFDVQTSATDFGTLTNSGTINVSSGATLTLSAATFTNAGSVDLLGGGAIVQIDRSLTLSGSGTVSLLGDGNNFVVDNNTSVTLTNHNTIAGAGTIGDSFMKLVNSGTIDANNSVGLSIDAAVINAGKMEGTTSGIGLYIVGGGTNAGTIEATTGGYVAIDSAFTNSKTIEALGSGQVQIFGGTVSNTSNGVVLASGSHAIVYLQDTIVGGTLKTSAGGQILVTENSVLSGVTIGLGTVLDVADNETLTLSGTTKNSGTLFADGAGSEVDIVSGAVVNGGVAEIGDGIVEIAGSSGESVRFLSTGSGGLEIADTQGHTSAFAGMVSGFGGSAHSNQAQFIDLVSVTSAGLITSHYTSAAGNTSGTLTVSSGGTLVASIKFVGAYSAGDFHITSGNGGTVAITDPTVPNGGSVQPGAGASLSRGTASNCRASPSARRRRSPMRRNTDAGGALTVTDGRHAAAIVLLGNYMAGSLVTTADGNGGTLLTQAAQTGQQPLLTHPVP